ncbi:hypothetical protein CDAR_552361 [Caerostris darwini]|uniref:Uncharacterized protein n=1 Tax=Caerostris darwini TaxID=1538125 RepID=A0AAV4NPU5_9ARAC|nr:hypothetical protein CDAR_552361 [Caerostris darwini]
MVLLRKIVEICLDDYLPKWCSLKKSSKITPPPLGGNVDISKCYYKRRLNLHQSHQKAMMIYQSDKFFNYEDIKICMISISPLKVTGYLTAPSLFPMNQDLQLKIPGTIIQQAPFAEIGKTSTMRHRMFEGKRLGDNAPNVAAPPPTMETITIWQWGHG